MQLEINNARLAKCTLEPGETHVDIPSDVRLIDWAAFQDCPGLQSVTIPDGVTYIASRSFEGCSQLTGLSVPASVENMGVSILTSRSLPHLDVPDGVTDIGYHEFSGMTGLQSIHLPPSVRVIGVYAFSGCTGLTEIALPKSVTRVDDGAFSCCSALTDIAIPEGVIELGESSFCGCTALTRVTLPSSLMLIGESAFYDCRHLTRLELPSDVKAIARNAFVKCPALTDLVHMPELLLHDCRVHLSNERAPHFQRDETSRLLLYLSHLDTKQDASQVRSVLFTDPAHTASVFLRAMQATKPTAAMAANLAQFLILTAGDVPLETVEAFRTLMEQGRLKKPLQQLDALLSELHAREEPALAALSPIEAYCRRYCLLIRVHAHLPDFHWPEHPVRLRDSEEIAPEIVLCAAIAPYALQYHGLDSVADRLHRRYEVALCPDADRAAAALHPQDFRDYLEALLEANDPLKDPTALIPYCRYADEVQMNALLLRHRRWNNWMKCRERGARASIVANGAELLSDTRAAMLRAEKHNFLDAYAKLRHTDAEVLRDTLLLDTGLDENGEKRFQLDGLTVIVRLDRNLALAQYDEATQERLFFLSRPDVTPEALSALEAQTMSFRRNVTSAIRLRVRRIFRQFLTGEGTPADVWEKRYMNDLLLSRIANLVVWSQDSHTFLLADGMLIDSMGRPYALTDAPVLVAHPLEMEASDLTAWKRYFARKQLRQPFLQLLEPVYTATMLSPGHFDGTYAPTASIPSLFQHGIWLKSNGDPTLTLVEGDIETTLEYSPTLKTECLLLGTFTYRKLTRWVNHIAYQLDRLTFLDRLLRDDPSAMNLLDQYSLHEIKKYLDLSIERECPACTAALLANYNARRQEEFPGNPMDAFLLD